jgi:hypothetical protein
MALLRRYLRGKTEELQEKAKTIHAQLFGSGMVACDIDWLAGLARERLMQL